MRTLLVILALLFSHGQTQAAELVQVLNIKEHQGSITATFSLGGTTLTHNEQGEPQISSVDTLQATLTVLHPETLTVQLPTFTDATFGDFTLKDIGKTSRKRTTQITSSASWIIEPYNPGDYKLPTLLITGVDANNNTEQLTLTLPSIQVIDSKTTPNNFAILPPRALPQPLPWKTIGISLSIIIVLIFIAIFIKRNRRPKPLSPKQCALLKLTELPDTNAEQIAELSLIIRHFLDGNFTLKTTERTYNEYAASIKKHPHILKPDTILTILKTCDESNYTGTPPPEETLTNLINQTKHYIEDSPEPLRPDEDQDTCGRW